MNTIGTDKANGTFGYPRRDKSSRANRLEWVSGRGVRVGASRQYLTRLRFRIPARALTRMAQPIGLVIVLILPLLLIADSLRVVGVMMLNYAVGLLIGVIRFKLSGPRMQRLL